MYFTELSQIFYQIATTQRCQPASLQPPSDSQQAAAAAAAA